MWVTEQLMVPVDFNGMFFSLQWKSVGSINCLVTHIHQNIFLCVQQKKEIHTAFEGE